MWVKIINKGPNLPIKRTYLPSNLVRWSVCSPPSRYFYGAQIFCRSEWGCCRLVTHFYWHTFFPFTLYTGLFDETASVIGYFASEFISYLIEFSLGEAWSDSVSVIGSLLLNIHSEVTYVSKILTIHEIFGKNDKLTIYTGQADATGMVAGNSRGAAAESLFCFHWRHHKNCLLFEWLIGRVNNLVHIGSMI